MELGARRRVRGRQAGEQRRDIGRPHAGGTGLHGRGAAWPRRGPAHIRQGDSPGVRKAGMEPDAAAFEAVLYPNRSLDRAGFIAVMLGVSTVSAAMSAGFVLIGAWPVTGFLGLDVLLLYLAFRAVRRAAPRREHIPLD